MTGSRAAAESARSAAAVISRAARADPCLVAQPMAAHQVDAGMQAPPRSLPGAAVSTVAADSPHATARASVITPACRATGSADDIGPGR
ncbi:hypothetical protein [Pseudonocardia sp.]|uniref:hypothetical protein n=1 Tax=Pseudonocardia sp. TaxID=60912 RepID=UPI002638751F|nr:hypothetical protein [Pseudonocardia sp.]